MVTDGITVLNIPISVHLYSLFSHLTGTRGLVRWPTLIKEIAANLTCPLSLGNLLRHKPLRGRAEQSQKRPLACHLQPDQEPDDCRSLPYPAEPCFINKTARPWCPQTGPKTMEPANHGLKFFETRNQNKHFFCLSWRSRVFYHRNGKLTRPSTMIDSQWL